MYKIKSLLIFITAILLFSACQPTPDEEIIVNKGDAQLQNAIQSSSTDATVSMTQSAIPEKIKWNDSFHQLTD